MQVSPGQQILRFIGHRPWLRGRDRVLRAFSHPDRRKSYSFEVPFFGKKYSGNLTNFIDWNVFYYGSFASHELFLLAAIAKAVRAQDKPVNFFDVGANIGHHTLFMSGYADRIFSFEPFSVVRDEMKRKLDYANVHNVTIFPVALGDREESQAFHPPTGSNQGTGTLSGVLPDNASSDCISVKVVRGDDFFAENSLPPISLLKMDVEGYEEHALEGMRETLRRDRPAMLLEIQRGASHNAAKGERIKNLLYPNHRIYEVDESRGQYVLEPFSLEHSEEVLVLPEEFSGDIPGIK